MNFSTVFPHLEKEKIDFLLIDAGKSWWNKGPTGKLGQFRDLTGATLRSLRKGSIVIFCDFVNRVKNNNIKTTKKKQNF